MNIKETNLDIKAFRDQLISKKTLAEQQIARANEAVKSLTEIMESITEEDINKLEASGIYIRDLMHYDLSTVMTDKELNRKFREQYIQVMRQIQDLIERESKVR